jgi:hypothetical protein
MATRRFPPTFLLHRGNDFAFQSLHEGTRFASRPVEPLEGGWRVVLNNSSEQISECLQHAEDCARKAAAQRDPGLRKDFLGLEKSWLALARSMEFAERSGFGKSGPKPNIRPIV